VCRPTEALTRVNVIYECRPDMSEISNTSPRRVTSIYIRLIYRHNFAFLITSFIAPNFRPRHYLQCSLNTTSIYGANEYWVKRYLIFCSGTISCTQQEVVDSLNAVHPVCVCVCVCACVRAAAARLLNPVSMTYMPTVDIPTRLWNSALGRPAGRTGR